MRRVENRAVSHSCGTLCQASRTAERSAQTVPRGKYPRLPFDAHLVPRIPRAKTCSSILVATCQVHRFNESSPPFRSMSSFVFLLAFSFGCQSVILPITSLSWSGRLLMRAVGGPTRTLFQLAWLDSVGSSWSIPQASFRRFKCHSYNCILARTLIFRSSPFEGRTAKV